MHVFSCWFSLFYTCMRMGALGEEWDPLRLHTSRTHIFLQHKNWECYHQEWPACVIYFNYIYTSKRQNYEKNTHTHTHYHSLKIYVFVWERESEAVSTPQSCRDDEKATQPPQPLPWKTFLSVFQFTVNRIFSSLSLFRCSCLSYPDSTAPSFIHLQSTLSELACLYK